MHEPSLKFHSCNELDSGGLMGEGWKREGGGRERRGGCDGEGFEKWEEHSISSYSTKAFSFGYNFVLQTEYSAMNWCSLK